MKKLLLYLLLIVTFTACSQNNTQIEKKVYYYDITTELKIQKSVDNIIELLISSSMLENFESIFIKKLNSMAKSENSGAVKFENYFNKILKSELNKRGYKLDTSGAKTLKISYATFGEKAILINYFLIENKNRKIVASAKEIIHIDICKIVGIKCEKLQITDTNSGPKRIIGLVDANCKENCVDKKVEVIKEEKKEVIEEVKIDYN